MASVLPHLLCLFILLIPVSILAQIQGNVSLGSSLSTLDANPFWASPSGEFAFGFHALAGGNTFLLAIRFHKIPSRTIVWTANDGQPVQRGSKVEVTDAGIILNDHQGNEIWSASPVDNSRATSAAMLNTGNFVLRSNQSTFIWESFENPTDTILPTQKLDRGKKLSSSLTEQNYTAGRFELRLQADGNLVSYTIARPRDDTDVSYWESHTDGSSSQLTFSQSGYIYLDLRNGSFFNLTKVSPVSVRDFYYKATLDFDGVFRQYTYPKNSSGDGTWPESWNVMTYVPENICMAITGSTGSGSCGFNSYCKIDEEQRPNCECPPGYIYIDPDNTFQGCKQNFTQQSCEIDGTGAGDGFRMEEIVNTDWPLSDYEMFKGVDEDFCREICLNDCLCAASISRVGNCWKKKIPLSNGRMDDSIEGKAHIKVGSSSSRPDIPPLPGSNKKNRESWLLPGSILLGSSAFLNCLFALAICLFVFGSYNKRTVKTVPPSKTFGMNLRSFTYQELEEATHGFKEELGRGGFSTVYKGIIELDSSRLVVAIKKLDMAVQDNDREFKNEVSAIGRTNHKNLVQLLGYCYEGPNRLLVYEFMTNGSLASFLFGSLRPNWYQRIQIAYGIARGLAYLHDECITPIIHCDVKPQNILLDDSFVARISDFGLAKLLKADQTRTRTGIRGTRGYVALEWFQSKAITAKVDVYSFGVVLLEIICCRKNVDSLVEGDDNMEVLSEWAYNCYAEGSLHLLVENDEEARNDGGRLERFILVAIWCIQDDPSLRPSMKKVTQMLEGVVEVPAPPDPFSLTSTIHSRPFYEAVI